MTMMLPGHGVVRRNSVMANHFVTAQLDPELLGDGSGLMTEKVYFCESPPLPVPTTPQWQCCRTLNPLCTPLCRCTAAYKAMPTCCNLLQAFVYSRPLVAMHRTPLPAPPSIYTAQSLCICVWPRRRMVTQSSDVAPPRCRLDGA